MLKSTDSVDGPVLTYLARSLNRIIPTQTDCQTSTRNLDSNVQLRVAGLPDGMSSTQAGLNHGSKVFPERPLAKKSEREATSYNQTTLTNGVPAGLRKTYEEAKHLFYYMKRYRLM